MHNSRFKMHNYFLVVVDISRDYYLKLFPKDIIKNMPVRKPIAHYSLLIAHFGAQAKL